MANSTVCQSTWKPIVEPRRAKPKTYRQAPTHWLKFYEEAVIESEVRTAVVQLKSEAQPSTMTGLTTRHAVCRIISRLKAPNSVNVSKREHKNQINHNDKQRRVLMANFTVCQSTWKTIVEPRRVKPKTYRQAPTSIEINLLFWRVNTKQWLLCQLHVALYISMLSYIY